MFERDFIKKFRNDINFFNIMSKLKELKNKIKTKFHSLEWKLIFYYISSIGFFINSLFSKLYNSGLFHL